MKTGVYCILNRLNGKRYIGSAASSLLKRITHHKWCLEHNRHINSYLQASWNKHGKAKFVFMVLERCLPEECLNREQYWMDFYKAADSRFGYNLNPTAGSMLGRKMSAETRKKHSEAYYKHPVSPENRRAMIEASRTPEALAKRRASLKGKCAKTAEHRRKLSEALKGRMPAREVIEQLAEINRARDYGPVSIETRKKMSLAKLGKPSAKLGKTYGPNLNYHSDPIAIQKKSEAARRGWKLRRHKK